MKSTKVVIILFLYFIGTITFFTEVAIAEKVNELEVEINGKKLPILRVENKSNEINLIIDKKNKIIKVKQETNPSINNAKDKEAPNTLNLFGFVLPVAIISALISAIVTFIIYFLNRRHAKQQIKFDLALKSLLPEVYIPLLSELSKNKLEDKALDIFKMKRVIDENAVLLAFAPNKSKDIISALYVTIKKIKGEKSYKQHEEQLINLLSNLENEIINRFGALKG